MYIDNQGFARNDKGNIICARCGKETRSIIMSWFNTDMICTSCRKQEEKDPRIKQAKKAEMEAIKRGNRNFKGIGW